MASQKLHLLRYAATFVTAAYCKSTPHAAGFACLEYEIFTVPSVLWFFTRASLFIQDILPVSNKKKAASAAFLV
ncbi:MAG: hypothetical protein U9P37_07790 [Pseudomonadota bacterium]|nr:hypothetical protein [Pseudomonadota bacterium]